MDSKTLYELLDTVYAALGSGLMADAKRQEFVELVRELRTGAISDLNGSAVTRWLRERDNSAPG